MSRHRQVVNTKHNTSGLSGSPALSSKTFDLNLCGFDRSDCVFLEGVVPHPTASSDPHGTNRNEQRTLWNSF
jgi:hypothetical protein